MKKAIRFWPIALGTYGAIGGIVSFSGWALDIPRLTDWFGTGISTQPNTALTVMAAGMALFFLSSGRLRAARWLGALVTLVGAATLFELITTINLGIDTLFLFGRTWGYNAVSAPGRMGAPGATSWVLIGLAILFETAPRRATKANIRMHAGAPGLAGFATVISAMSLIGYLFGASALYSIPTATAIAIQTATFILALSLGVILSEPLYGPARLIYEESIAGTMFRRMLPALVMVPLILGYLRLTGERLGYYDLAFGTAGRTVAEIAILLLFVWLAAGDVNKVERARRKIEDQLTQNEALLRTVTEEAEIGLVILDRDHRYLYANRAYCRIIRADPNTIIGRSVREMLPGAYETRIHPKLEAAFNGETVRYELEMPELDQFVSVTYQPVFRQGLVERVIVAIVDTTARRKIEDALQQSRTELQVAARRKDEFLMTLAHELRNPLAPIRTAVDLMNRTPAGGDTSHVRDVIDRQMKLMVRLLDDLLDVGRIERDTLTLRKSRIDLGNVIRNAVEISQPLADRFKQEIVVRMPAQPIDVDADSARLEQVVANLLNNACRFTPADGRIELSIERDGHNALVRVRDNGIGIAREDLSRVFNMFEQLDRSNEQAQGGLGIGLHLVKRLVQMHGGTVEARSEGIGHGSEFRVYLPALPDVPRSEAPVKVARTTPTQPKRILVVDDNVDAAMALSMLLGVIGHETHTAHTGPDALDAVSKIKPDVVLLDLGLPGMSGFEVCERIRTAAGDEQPMVVALTGWGQESDRQKSRNSGFDHHLVKPVDYDALADLLDASPR